MREDLRSGMILGARIANRTPGAEIDGELSATLSLGFLPVCPSFGHDVLITRQSSSENSSEISTVEMIASALLIVAYLSIQSTTELSRFALRIIMHNFVQFRGRNG